MSSRIDQPVVPVAFGLFGKLMAVDHDDIVEERGDYPGADNDVESGDEAGIEDPLQAVGKNTKMADSIMERNCDNADLTGVPIAAMMISSSLVSVLRLLPPASGLPAAPSGQRVCRKQPLKTRRNNSDPKFPNPYTYSYVISE